MTNGNSDRLDRIEQTLERVAERYEKIARRDEITAIRLERLSLQQEEHNRQIHQIRAIAESNSRTIQGMLERRESERLQKEEEKAQHEERMARLEENLTETRKLMAQMTQTQQGLTQILIGYDEDRPTILRRLMTLDNKVDQLLDRTEQ